MNQAATIAATIEAAAIGAVALILGAVIALVASLTTSRSLAKSTLLTSGRPAVETLQKRFHDFRGEVWSARSVAKSGPRLEEILSDLWNVQSALAAVEAATVTRSRARRGLETAIEALDRADDLGQHGLGLRDTIREDMWQIADDGFQIASAVLRSGRIPAGPLRRLRALRRHLRWLYADWDELATLQRGKKMRKSGLVRRVWRKVSRAFRKVGSVLSFPFRWLFSYLFRP